MHCCGVWTNLILSNVSCVTLWHTKEFTFIVSLVDSKDEMIGVDIVKRALKAPCATIARNAGVESSEVVEQILRSKEPNYGFDALREEYTDMMKAGKKQISINAHHLINWIYDFVNTKFTKYLNGQNLNWTFII